MSEDEILGMGAYRKRHPPGTRYLRSLVGAFVG